MAWPFVNRRPTWHCSLSWLARLPMEQTLSAEIVATLYGKFLHRFHVQLLRFIDIAGQVGEQATMFFYDPSDNALEFKAFKDPDRLFAR